jgi:O-antigen ligase
MPWISTHRARLGRPLDSRAFDRDASRRELERDAEQVVASVDPSAPRASILDLYRATWNALRQAIARYHVAIAAEIGLVAAWFVLRSLVDVTSTYYIAWAIAACLVTVIAPTSGLVILVATVPFFEPHSVTRALGMRDLLVGALGISVAFRIAAGGWRQLPRSPALILGAVVAAITAAGVAHTAQVFGPDLGTHVAQEWLDTIGGAMILLIVGAWVARTGALRQLVAAAIACAVAAVLSLVELAQPGLISDGALSWIGFWKDFGVRVSGIIPAPNAVATMLVIPATAALAAAAHFHGVRRMAALTLALPMAVAAILTLSRTAIAAFYVAAVVFVGRRRPRAAVVMVVGGLILAVVSVPLFIEFRANRVGIFATQSPIEWLIGADQARITAWATSIRMWMDSPIIGHGFLSYKLVAESFGDPRLGSPHNEVLRLFAEEGVIGGIAMIAFIGSLLRGLARRPGWLGSGLLAGAIGYWLAAMFNNPLLFIQVSAMTFVFAGYGLTAPIDDELLDAQLSPPAVAVPSGTTSMQGPGLAPSDAAQVVFAEPSSAGASQAEARPRGDTTADNASHTLSISGSDRSG